MKDLILNNQTAYGAMDTRRFFVLEWKLRTICVCFPKQLYWLLSQRFIER